MSISEKRVHILTIAEKLFSEQGFNGTSIRDIADAAGVNISMISYYFGSKEGLMQALFEDRTSHILPRLELLVKDQKMNSFEKIDILIEDYIQKAHKNILFHKILIGEQMLQKNSIITELIHELKRKNTELLEQLIAEGQKKGLFKKKVDIVLMMNTMTGTISQTLINQDYYKKYYGLEKLSPEESGQLLRKKLSTYIKDLFKSILSYEV